MKTTYTQKNVLAALFQATAFPLPTSPLAFALVQAAYGKWAASTAYGTTGELVSPSTVNGHFYALTTAGTSGTTEPVWPTAPGATVTDGTCVWTEQAAAQVAGTLPEVSGGGYARATMVPSAANFPITAVTGATQNGQQAENAAAISYGSGNTTAAWGYIVGVMVFDSAATPNCLRVTTISNPVQINSGDPLPQFPINDLVFEEF